MDKSKQIHGKISRKVRSVCFFLHTVYISRTYWVKNKFVCYYGMPLVTINRFILI